MSATAQYYHYRTRFVNVSKQQEMEDDQDVEDVSIYLDTPSTAMAALEESPAFATSLYCFCCCNDRCCEKYCNCGGNTFSPEILRCECCYCCCCS